MEKDGMTEIVLAAEDKNLEKAQSFVRLQVENLFKDKQILLQIDLVVEELFINIAHYAYCAQSGTVRIAAETDGTVPEVKITFCDSGIPFNPLERSDPDTTLPAEQRSVGGLGIFLTKKIMDRVEYRRADGKNILTVTKRTAQAFQSSR